MTTTVQPARHDHGGRRSWLRHPGVAMAVLALGVSLVIMDATVVNVALPMVIRDLHMDASGAQWMNAIYSLVFASLLLVLGRLGDLFGRKRLFAAGLVIFMGASIVAGAATGQSMLIGARLIQGIGAAMVLPATLSTLNAMFTGRARAVAFAVWGSTIGGMAAIGPLVGGWLATDVSWRWAFWLNIPVGLLVLAGVGLVIPETRDSGAGRGIDWRGALLVTGGMTGVVFALIQGGYYGWWTTPAGDVSSVPVVAAVGLVLLVLFVALEKRRGLEGKPVLMDLGLLRLPTYRYGLTAALVVALGEFGLLFTLPLLLQGALGYDPLGTGLLMVALAAGTFVISGATPALTRRLGQRAVVRIGLVLETIGITGLAVSLTASIPGWALAAWLATYGVGVGLATAQLTSVILHDVPPAESGQASGLQTAIRQLGAALGVAILGGLLVGSATSATRANVADLNLPPAVQSKVVEMVHDSAGAAIPALAGDRGTAPAIPAAQSALVSASKITTGAAAGILVLGLGATLALPYVPTTDEVDSAVEGEEAGDDRRHTGQAAGGR